MIGGSLYHSVTELFYQLSNAFFWPVAFALLVLFGVALADLGAMIVQIWRRRTQPRTDLAVVARSLVSGLAGDGRFEADPSRMSPSLARFWGRVERRLAEVQSRENVDIWLEEVLQREEIEATSRLDRTRAMIRLGPMLGLAGTIIPLGPALQSLLGGDLAGMVNHLVVGFGAVVCGLVMSGVSYVIALVRERWVRVDLKEMENLSELLLRGVAAKAAGREAL
jgi:Biopolymer transport proteins